MSITSELKSQLQEHLAMIEHHRENRRSHEEILNDIKTVLVNINKETFLPFVLQMMSSIHMRYESKIFKNLMSPLKQLSYVIDIYFSINHTEYTKQSPDEKGWDKMTELLHECEMTYFGEIGFFDEHSGNVDFNKVSTSLKAFFDYYANGQLSFDEQTLHRLQTNFTKFDQDIFKQFGFTSTDIVDFCMHLQKLIHKKVDSTTFYQQNPEEWPKVTQSLIDKGINDPKDWIDQPELKELRDLMLKPGCWFMHSPEQISNSRLDLQVTKKILDFLIYDEKANIGKTLYYDNPRTYFDSPLIQLSEKNILCPPFKLLIEAFYNRINLWLTTFKKEKYVQHRNKMLEEKTTKIFRDFFGEEALIFTSYYIDPADKAEQDLLIFHKGCLLIVEIKDFKFRAPMRNPIKAFDKIKSDFKAGIQRAYDQCLRLEQKIQNGANFTIYADKTNKPLFEIRPKRVKTYHSIIVTQHKYGAIQTDLNNLLAKEPDDIYPWSVCVDDLEIFLLCLKKMKMGESKSSFKEFIDHREAFHERLVCSDELEMCGLYLSSTVEFKRYAEMEEHFACDARMSEVFDAYYGVGLGFENEMLLERKKKNPLRNYANKFDANIVSRDDLK